MLIRSYRGYPCVDRLPPARLRESGSPSRYCQMLCIEDGRILLNDLLSGLLGLFFTIDETDTGNYL